MEAFAKNEYDDYMILDFARENREIQQNFIEYIFSQLMNICLS